MSITTELTEFSIFWNHIIGPWMVLGLLILVSKFGVRLFSYSSYSKTELQDAKSGAAYELP